MAARSRSILHFARSLFQTVLVLLLLSSFLVATLFLVGRSSWGRQHILSLVLPAVEKQLVGKLRIGALDGDFTHMLVLRDVELSDGEGQLVARLPYIGLRYNLLALLGRTLHIHAVDLKRAELHVRTLKDGRLNILTLTRPDDSPPSSQPLPLRILVSGIDVELSANFDGGSSFEPLSRAAAELRLRGGLHLRPDRRLSVDLDELGIASSAPLLAKLALRGKLALWLLDVQKSLSLSDVALTLTTDGTEVTRLVPGAQLTGPLSLTAKLDGTLEKLISQFKLELPKGRAELQTTLGLLDAKLPWQLALSLDSVDPGALCAGLPASQIDLSLHGSGSGASGRLDLQALRVRTAKNTLRLAGTILTPSTMPLWQDPLGAQADLSLHVEAHDLSEAARLGALLPTLGGSLVGSVRVKLQQRALRLFSHLRGTELRGPGIELGRLQLDLETTDLSGKLQLVADNLSAAGQRLARLALTAEGDRRLLRLNLDGEGPDAVRLKLAAQARPELSGGSGIYGLVGAQLSGLVAELTELQIERAGAKLLLVSPAELRLTQLNEAPIAEVSMLAFSLGTLKLHLGGRYETQGQRLRARLDASHFDVQELVRVATGATTLPKSQLDVHLEVAGTIASPTGQLRLSGQLEPLPGALPWRVMPELAATFGGRRIRGALALHTETTPSQENSPSVKARFDLPLGLDAALELKLDADSALEALRPLLPPALHELSGAVAAEVSLGGTLEQPQAALKLRLPRWQVAPVRGTQTMLSITYERQKLDAQLSSHVTSLDGQPLLRAQFAAQAPLRLGKSVNGSQVIEQLRRGAATAELALHDLALPRLLAIAQGTAQEELLSKGTAELAVQVRGPLLSPKVAARVDASGLRSAPGRGLMEAPLHASLQLNYEHDALGLTLNLDLDGKPLLRGRAETALRMAELLRDGNALIGRLPLHANVELLPLPLPPGLPLRGSIAARAEIHGTPQLPQFTADASATGLLFEDWPVGDLKMHAALGAQKLIKVQADIAQKAAGGSGSLSLDAAVPLPFAMTATAFQAALVANHFRLDYQAKKGTRASVRLVRGILDSNLTLRGNAPQPLVLGSLDLRDGQLSTAALPQLLRDIVVKLRAKPDGILKLEQAAARAEKGRIRAEGGVQLVAGTLRNIDLAATIDNFPVPAGSLGMWLDTKLEVVGRAPDDTLRVKVTIPHGTVRLPKLTSGNDSDVQALGPLEDVRFIDAAARAAAAEAEAEAERRSAAAQKKEAHSAPPLLPQRTLVSVDLPPAFMVTGPEVKTNIQGHLDAELSAQQPSGPILTGEIRTLGGWVEILGRRYQLDRAQVSMSGEVPPNPLLNIVLWRKLDDTTIYIQVGGTARKPSITFRSDPAIYDQAQVIGMVLSGSRGGSIQQQALGALSGLLVGKLKDSLGKAVPLDVIKLDVGGNDASGANQSSLEVGKYLRDNLYLSYTHRFGSPSTILRRLNNDQVALEWYFLPDYQINLMGGDQGVGSLNLYWTKRF